MSTVTWFFLFVGLISGAAISGVVVVVHFHRQRDDLLKASAESEARVKAIEERLAEKDAAVAEARAQIDAANERAEGVRTQMRQDAERLQAELLAAVEARSRMEGEGITSGALQKQLAERDDEVTRLYRELSRANEQLAEAKANAAATEKSQEAAMRAKEVSVALQLEEKERSLQAQMAERQRAVDEQKKMLAEAERKLSETFESLSARALSAATEQLLKFAETRFATTQEEARGELARRQQAVDELIRPLSESLDKLSRQCHEMEQKRTSAYDAVSAQIDRMMVETLHLSSALRRPGVRGSWGEITLRTVAENAGLVEGQDFELQHTTDSEDGRLRPDMIVRLPNKRAIVIDSKTPLDAYRDAMNAQERSSRDRYLQDHSRLVRNHIKQLGAKSYQSQYDGADYVIMFLPAESIYQAALEYDTTLMEDAIKARVLLANPMTLVGLLKAVAYVLDQERLNKSAAEVSEIGRKLYDGIRIFAGHLGRVGRHLRQSVDAYNASVGSLERSVLSRARRLRQQGVAGDDAIADVDEVDILPASFRSDELGALSSAECDAADRPPSLLPTGS